MPFNFPSKLDPRARRNSTKPSARNRGADLLPYRDVDNRTIAYTATSTSHDPQAQTDGHHDSDAEPLVAQSSTPNELPKLSEYDLQHFTATGGPAPRFKASSLAYMAGDMSSVPQLLPKRYTDDSIIPAIISDVIPSPKAPEASSKPAKKPGLFRKLKGSSKKEPGPEDKLLKVVYMPRRDYLKWFARDKKGNYSGSEEHRRWTEDELEAKFGQFKPESTKAKKDGLLSGTGSGAGTSGA